ncbi:unnamed protein product [Heterobilharzia americana]|nr:unnamed protein product [Heterobilharzia americana]
MFSDHNKIAQSVEMEKDQTFDASELGRTISRINALPINIQIKLTDAQYNIRSDSRAILHSSQLLRKKLRNVKEHMKPLPFPDRQLYIYVIADPTDMRIELTKLRAHVWPYLQRICNERGFALHIIDDNMDTDIEPRNQLTMTSYGLPEDTELKLHLSRRMKQKNFLNCLILLSNRSVGPVVPLPPYLPNSLIHQIKTSALEEIEDLKTEITMLSEKLPGFDSPRLLRRLSRYLSSQNSLRSQPEEGNTKQLRIQPQKETIPLDW